ncbi:MAG: bifunctional diguanylate cyclase/phosphodiesterase, partial [Euzebyales bacterium]|nr:bifunctional diguanylate cyclase/phosphodiesterase [Euzebyales bacterium]
AAVAERLGEALRPGDLLARLGGDEFAILCPRVGTAEAARGIAERLTAALAPPFTLDGAEVFVTAGVGVALSRGRRVGAERLLRDAGAALHRAKELGGGRVATYDQQLHTRAVGRLRTDSELRRALQRGELRLDYQPIVSLDCGRLDGVEALLRWQHPERGLVAPLDFLPVAEETGLIVPIGSWVVRETLAQLRRWDERFPDQRPVAAGINLSGRQVLEPGLAAMVATALDEAGVDPGRIVMEITESVVMEDVATSARVLGELKGLGLRLAIDDFGTGFSSLSYLKRFPVDLLKVDRSFVRGVGADAGDAAIVDAVITLARALCLSTVAEGVETLAQRDRLQDLGCGYAQGWLYGRPVAPDLLLPLLAGDRVAPAAGDATGAPSP